MYVARYVLCEDIPQFLVTLDMSMYMPQSSLCAKYVLFNYFDSD